MLIDEVEIVNMNGMMDSIMNGVDECDNELQDYERNQPKSSLDIDDKLCRFEVGSRYYHK